MERYTFALTIFMLNYISRTQAGLLDTFLKPNQGLDPLKEINPLYQMNKAKGALEEVLIDNRDSSYENDREFRQNSQSQPDRRGFVTEITTRKTNRGPDPLNEFKPLYQMNKVKGAVEEALVHNRENNQQNERGFWSTSQNEPATKGFYKTQTIAPVDEKAAHLFPQGVDHFNTLQEHDKFREEGKLPIRNKPTAPNTPLNRPNNTIKKKEMNILKSTKVNKVLKPLTKRKFYYQVQPVIPDNERRDDEETIYYIDL